MPLFCEKLRHDANHATRQCNKCSGNILSESKRKMAALGLKEELRDLHKSVLTGSPHQLEDFII